jgi:hypothetical protein
LLVIIVLLLFIFAGLLVLLRVVVAVELGPPGINKNKLKKNKQIVF